MTTCLTTFRTGLPGDSSTRWTLYQFFRTKKHVLEAISRKKPYPFAWGGRGRKFKSCHSTRRRFARISSFLLFSPFFSFFHVYKVLTAIFIPAKNCRNSRHDHIRDHRFFKLHPLITFLGFFSKNFGGSLLLRTAFFLFFLIFQSLQQCISSNNRGLKFALPYFPTTFYLPAYQILRFDHSFSPIG